MGAYFLPTFNTRSILTNIDHIPELAENFIIGNDDVFLSHSVLPDFFFQEGNVVVRGEYCDMTDPRFDTLHFDGLKCATRILKKQANRYLTLSHGFMPLKLTCLKELRARFPAEFANNEKYRFRHQSQFLVEVLVSQFLLEKGQAILEGTEEMIHFSFQLCREGTEEKLKFLFSLLQTKQRSMFCINDFSALETRFAWVGKTLDKICSPANFD